MNTYRTSFSRRCPVNNDLIFYDLEIRSEAAIMAELIREAVEALPTQVLHESAADELSKALPGAQTMTAQHGFVHITTERATPAPGHEDHGTRGM